MGVPGWCGGIEVSPACQESTSAPPDITYSSAVGSSSSSNIIASDFAAAARYS